MTVRFLKLLLAALAFGGAGSSTAQELRFTAVLDGGRRVRGDEVRPWDETTSRPKLDGVDLFAEENPVSWLRDESLPEPRKPRAFVEFVGGDVLPGQVVAFASGDEVLDDPSLPYVLVEPEVSFEPHDSPPRSGLRVLTRHLRRVVWTTVLAKSYEPSTLFYRDGSRISFRSVRFGEGEVSVLLPEGIRRVPFDQIAELHLARTDPWEVYFEEVAVLAPDGTSRLVSIETIDGLRLTSSLQRFRVDLNGARDEPKSWVHVFQPAWSLDPVWIPHRSIRTRVYHHPARVPLSRFLPSRVVRRSIFGGSWRFQQDRSVHGGTLASGGAEYAWGFGVQAHAELEFLLHAAVRHVETSVGLDHAVTTGGCVETSVVLRLPDEPSGATAPAVGSVRRARPAGDSTGSADPGRPDEILWRSGVLTGSSRTASTGALEIPERSARAGARLVLIASAEVESRPAGADPLDIRDSVDWLEPVLALDESILREEVFASYPRIVPSLARWEVRPEDRAAPLFVNRWDAADADLRRFRLLLDVGARRVEFVRRLAIDERRSWFFAAASRPSVPPVSATDPPRWVGEARVELRVDGVAAEPFDVPRRRAGEAPPQALIAPLSARVNGDSEIRLLVRGERQDSEVDLRALRFLASAPGSLQLFEDDLGTVIRESRREGVWLREWREPFRGVASLKVLPDQPLRVDFGEAGFRIRARPAYGEYRYLRFAWRKKGEGRVALGLGHDGEWGQSPRRVRQSFLFDQGRGEPTRKGGRRLSRESASRWAVHTTDLVAAFGEFSLTGLEFICPDGDFALFDHVWLARTPRDWEGVTVAPFLESKAWDEAMARSEPGFSLDVPSEILEAFRERPFVRRTSAPDEGGTVVWRRLAEVDELPGVRLVLSVAHDIRGAWTLEVLVDGERIFDRLVDPESTADGWLDVEVPLSRFSGRRVNLEIVQRARGRAYGFAYWWLVRLEGPR